MNTIKTFCKKHNITEDQFLGKEKINGSIYLSSLTALPGFSPTVGGSLDLRGSHQYIGSSVNIEVKTTNSFFWEGYAKIDGIFCQVDAKRIITIKSEEYILRTGKKIMGLAFYILSKGDFHAHGKDLKSAFEDLQFKIQSERFKKEPITEETPITVIHYRAITGACNMGCKIFMEKYNIPFTEVNEKVVEKIPIKAKDLLKILKKDNAHGVEKFEKANAEIATKKQKWN